MYNFDDSLKFNKKLAPLKAIKHKIFDSIKTDGYHFISFLLRTSLPINKDLASHMLPKEIIEKYNVASPRYTSYPTILDWNQSTFQLTEFKKQLLNSFTPHQKTATSVYIHLHFCESLCTFCGCHKYITKNHSVEEPYIETVIKEWELYKSATKTDLQVSELHLGGGTPTFFSVESLDRLLVKITSDKTDNVNYSVEDHPNHTSEAQLKLFFNYGFRRISFGVQGYDPEVQRSINRIQSFDQVKKVTEQARAIGFTSISHDLVFGLPKQTMEAMKKSITLTLSLRPDNISLYSYAHVPWVKGTGQRGYSEADLPDGKAKRALYEYAKEMLLEAGYLEIGMDHFGLPTEPMTKAMLDQKLNRNFMGYTTSNTERMIALGASAISEYPFGYAQNEKNVKAYQEKINAGDFAVTKGHIHSELDLELKKHIKALMCNFETIYDDNSYIALNKDSFKSDFESFEKDGILKWNNNQLKITKAGRPFVRNLCTSIDPYVNKKSDTPRFSKSV